MSFAERKGSDDADRWLSELQMYEEQAERLTRALEEKNGEYARAEAPLMRLINENLSIVSRIVKSAGCTTTGIVDGDRSCGVHRLQDELKAAQQTLENSRKNEELAATALSRIKAFISLHDENREFYLDRVGKAAERLKSARSECERHSKSLKLKLGFASEKDSLNEGHSAFSGEQLQFLPGEEKLAPHHVELMRKAASLLEPILATTALLKRLGDLCLIRQKHLRDTREATMSQLLAHRSTLRDISSAIDTSKKALHDLRVANGTKKKARDVLQNDVENLRISSKDIESSTTMNEEALNAQTEIAMLEQVLVDALRSTQDAQDAEREAAQLAQSESQALERAREAADHVRRDITALEKEKVDICKNIESLRVLKQRHILDADKHERKMKDVQNEMDQIEQDKKIVEEEAGHIRATLSEAKKHVEMLVSQCGSKEGRRSMLCDEKRMVDDDVEALKTVCVRTRDELTKMRKTILMLRQRGAKAAEHVRYIISLSPNNGPSTSVASLSTGQLECGGYADECLREVLALKDKNLLGRARRKLRVGSIAGETVCRSGTKQDAMNCGFGGSRGLLRQPQSSSATQQSPQAESSKVSLVISSASKHYRLNDTAVDSQMSSALSPIDGQPTGVTSRIVRGTPRDDSLSPPNTTVIYANNRRMRSSSSGREKTNSSVLHKGEVAPTTSCLSYHNRDVDAETTPTIARINVRLHEILSRKY